MRLIIMKEAVFVFATMIAVGAVMASQSHSEYLSPKKQLELGVLPEDIQCREDRVLAIRDNGNPACVTNLTAEKLNWKIVNLLNTVNEGSPSGMPKSKVLDLSSPVEFVDDGREIKMSVLQKSPAPSPMYDRIMKSMNDGVSINDEGLTTIITNIHEKYSVNPGVGFYAEDWLPEYIPDGQKLLYTETTCYESGDCTLGINFVPTTFELFENVTSHDLQFSKGFYISVKHSVLPLEEVEDKIEHLEELFSSQPGYYGGFVDMTRDGKTVHAFEGGNNLNHYRANLYFQPDEHTGIGVLSHYHTLDELIPVFNSIMRLSF